MQQKWYENTIKTCAEHSFLSIPTMFFSSAYFINKPFIMNECENYFQHKYIFVYNSTLRLFIVEKPLNLNWNWNTVCDIRNTYEMACVALTLNIHGNRCFASEIVNKPLNTRSVVQRSRSGEHFPFTCKSKWPQRIFQFSTSNLVCELWKKVIKNE